MSNVLCFVNTLKILVLSIVDKHLIKIPIVTNDMKNQNYGDLGQVFVYYCKTNVWYKGESDEIS